MMVPENVQETIPRNQAEELKQFTDKYLSNNAPYGSLNGGLIESIFTKRLGYAYNSDKLSADQALKDQKDIWTRYLIAFTTAKAALKNRLQSFPESGEIDSIEGLRRFPIYDGRYSAKWIVSHVTRTVTLIALSDSKHPKNLRQFQFDE